MKRAISIEQDLSQISTVKDLTEVFEGIASIKISRIRNRVVIGKAFFDELWATYTSIRINPEDRMTPKKRTSTNKAFVVVTSSGKLSGDIASRVIDEMAKSYEKGNEVILFGSVGAERLTHHGITPVRTYALPDSDTNFDVTDIITHLGRYEFITVFYQAYESLRVQQVAKIELFAAIRELGESTDQTDGNHADIVSTKDYIFEPNSSRIAEYLESLMLGVALSQIIMESKLAQYAARFNSMSLAKQRAHELSKDYGVQYHQAKRAEADERLKETMKIGKGVLA